ncbi:stAR-related lipid transfer protein 13-like [Chelydra serpentina]|uniref:StAR-related lipid transfer protein 13-like n=1 Tax=Chelydra serpentina TaxID=8475 RepID=A0A8T1SEI7_CHESE|nr:stAR-related lipid transfer protein 13-like [Chelydra serpentina]
MKSTGMEAKISEKEQVSPYFIYATSLGTSEESKNAKYETKVEECDCHHEFHNVLLESDLSSSSMSQLVSYTETSLEPSRVTGHVTAAAEPEVKHLCGKLLYSSGHKPKDCPTHLPSHEAFPSALLPRESSAEKSERVQEIRVITHKPSAITFSDFEFLSHSANSKLHICEVRDTEASSSEEEEEGDDDNDVFTELPLYGAFYNGLYKRTILLGKTDKCGHTRSQYVCHLDSCNDHTGKKLNDHEKEEKQMDMVVR